MKRKDNKKSYFSSNDIKDLTKAYSKLSQQYAQVLPKYTALNFSNAQATEYMRHGFARRISLLRRCMENIWNIYPPHKSEIPDRNDISDLMINLQSFIFNIFGCIDNLAWIWVKENNFSYKRPHEITFSNPVLLNQLSVNFKKYYESQKGWLGYLTNYRHSLAHRIPLYVPPRSLTKDEGQKYRELEDDKLEALEQGDLDKYEELDKEQDNLGRFLPWMLHSFSENALPVEFHVRLLVDWETIIDFSEEFLKELKC